MYSVLTHLLNKFVKILLIFDGVDEDVVDDDLRRK